jgi:hypothetical protein
MAISHLYNRQIFASHTARCNGVNLSIDLRAYVSAKSAHGFSQFLHGGGEVGVVRLFITATEKKRRQALEQCASLVRISDPMRNGNKN